MKSKNQDRLTNGLWIMFWLIMIAKAVGYIIYL